MAITLDVEHLSRQGTTAEWESSSYILKSGEIGYDTESGVIKMGDGASLWSALPAFAPGIIIGDGLYAE